LLSGPQAVDLKRRIQPPAANERLGVTTQVSGFGSSGFRKSSRAGTIFFAILPYGRLGPAAIGFGQLHLKGRFHAIEHPKALLINDHIFQPSKSFHLSLLNPEPSLPE
jgi:hypothetical protein